MTHEWKAEIVGPADPLLLAMKLAELEASGWSVWQVLVNGLDRWTVICRRERT